MLRRLKPRKDLVIIADKMFQKLWAHRKPVNQSCKSVLEQEVSNIDEKLETLLDRVVDTESTVVMKWLEGRIVKIENSASKKNWTTGVLQSDPIGTCIELLIFLYHSRC